MYLFSPEKICQKNANMSNTNSVDLNLDFDKIVGQAMRDASQDCQKLGLQLEHDDCNIVDIANNWQDEENDSVNRETVNTCGNLDLNLTDNFNTFIINDSVLEGLNRENLDLKDYSGDYANKDLAECSPFVRVNLSNGKSKIIKKSSFCWLLYEGKGKVSVDRLRRFVTNTKLSKNPTKKNPTLRKCTRKTVKLGGKRKNKNQFPETDIESDYSLNDSTDSESFSDSEHCNNESNMIEKLRHKNEKCVSKSVLKEHYYAVLYDEGWYVGRVVEKLDGDVFRMKFLKQEVNVFIWPKNDDITEVNKKIIFYGPIQLIGSGPFQICTNDLGAINKQYKNYKHNLR